MKESLHIVCPECGAVNRVPDAKLADGPKCGRCTRKLFTSNPVGLTGDGLQKHILRNEIPVVVDFWAPWCGPCKMMAPVFQQAAAQFEPNIRFAKVNTQDEPAVADQFHIRGIPTTIIFRDGREIIRQAGAMDFSSLVRWIKSNI